MNDTLKKVLVGVVIIVGSVAVGRYTAPTKVEEKENIVYKDRIVEKKVFEKDTSKKNDTVTVRLVTIKPDGTRTIETKIVNKDEIIVSENGKTDVVKETEATKETDKLVESKHDDWNVSVAIKMDSGYNLSYGAHVQRRILGPFTLGAFGYTDVSGGLSLGLNF